MAETTFKKYTLQNLDCANCAAKIETAVQQTQGVKFASVDFATTTLYLDADDFSAVQSTIQRVEPQISVLPHRTEAAVDEQFNVRKELILILIAAGLFFLGLIFIDALRATPFGIAEWLVFGAAYLLSGWGVLTSAFRNIIRGQVFDEHFLMSIATIGAILIGELPEAVGVMLFYLVGEFAQELSVSRSRRSIQALLEVRPDKANVLINGQVKTLDPEMVPVGAELIVRPGERIPLDGEVISGNSLVDTSALTGESRPRNARNGESVLGGMINQTGVLTIRVMRPFEESSISRILELVQNAGSRKAKTEKFITQFARVYSPIVVALAAAVAILPPLFTGAPFSEWLYRALVVLVISCPCALVISIPLGYFGGVGGAARRGILVKGSNYLDILAAVRSVIFDKTGTLTQGAFRVTRSEPRNGYTEADLLQWAAQAEAGSNHPIAQSIREAQGEIATTPIGAYQEIAGKGVCASISGRELLAGSDGLLHHANVEHDADLCQVAGTVVHVAIDGEHAGYLLIADELKPEAHQAIRDLRSVGVEQIVMLTGDAEPVAQQVAHALGMDDYRAELLPEDKMQELEALMAVPNRTGKLAFVGDGINDAPALARADVGIAMGALGSEAAIETADVVIMTDSPAKVAEAIKIGRRTRTIVWQNIILALLIKSAFIGLGIIGIANMWMAVIGDMGVALLAVANAMRVLQVPHPDK
jgi:Cd2+/Zn2+-exporting ATPase